MSVSSKINNGTSIQDYSLKLSIKGYKLFKYKNKRVSRKNVPDDIAKQLIDKVIGLRNRGNADSSSFSITHQYTYMPLGDGSFFYYQDGIFIEKCEVPLHAFDNMRDERSAGIWRERWYKLWKLYKEGKEKADKTYRKCNSHKDSLYHKAKRERENIDRNNQAGLPDNINPETLLKDNGITTRKEWLRWLQINHPDKNPNIDVNLVALINTAAEMLYG